jgi:hypothetical protein
MRSLLAMFAENVKGEFPKAGKAKSKLAFFGDTVRLLVSLLTPQVISNDTVNLYKLVLAEKADTAVILGTRIAFTFFADSLKSQATSTTLIHQASGTRSFKARLVARSHTLQSKAITTTLNGAAIKSYYSSAISTLVPSTHVKALLV